MTAGIRLSVGIEHISDIIAGTIDCVLHWKTTMEKIGESSENPFEGSANDVPITAMSRTIEIDLREMLGEQNIPAPLQPQNNILT